METDETGKPFALWKQCAGFQTEKRNISTFQLYLNLHDTLNTLYTSYVDSFAKQTQALLLFCFRKKNWKQIIDKKHCQP